MMKHPCNNFAIENFRPKSKSLVANEINNQRPHRDRGKLFIACPSDEILDIGLLSIHEDADAINLGSQPNHNHE